MLKDLKVKCMPDHANACATSSERLSCFDDATTSFCLNIFGWAAYGQHEGGIKLHTILNYDGLLLAFCHLTDAQTHEVRAARKHIKPKGGVLVFDKGHCCLIGSINFLKNKTNSQSWSIATDLTSICACNEENPTLE